MPQLFMIRNTSVIVKWQPPHLEEHCDDIVVSYPPVIFGILVDYAERPIHGFPIVSNSDILNQFCIHYYNYYYSTHMKWNIQSMVCYLSVDMKLN